MASRRRAALLLLGLATLTGCGPTDEEVARAVLFITPVPIAVGLGLLLVLRWAWRKLRPDVAMDVRPQVYAVGFAVCFSGVALFGQRFGDPGTPSIGKIVGLSWITLWAWGTSYLAVLLVAWRIWFALRPAAAFTWSFVVPVIALLGPAAPIASGLTDKLGPIVYVWVYAGCAGIVPGAALLLALLEVLVRVKLRKRSAEEAPRLATERDGVGASAGALLERRPEQPGEPARELGP